MHFLAELLGDAEDEARGIGSRFGDDGGIGLAFVGPVVAESSIHQEAT